MWLHHQDGPQDHRVRTRAFLLNQPALNLQDITRIDFLFNRKPTGLVAIGEFSSPTEEAEDEDHDETFRRRPVADPGAGVVRPRPAVGPAALP